MIGTFLWAANQFLSDSNLIVNLAYSVIGFLTSFLGGSIPVSRITGTHWYLLDHTANVRLIYICGYMANI